MNEQFCIIERSKMFKDVAIYRDDGAWISINTARPGYIGENLDHFKFTLNDLGGRVPEKVLERFKNDSCMMVNVVDTIALINMINEGERA